MLEQLRDWRFLPFYRLVARRFVEANLDHLIYHALSEIESEIEDEQRDGGLL